MAVADNFVEGRIVYSSVLDSESLHHMHSLFLSTQNGTIMCFFQDNGNSNLSLNMISITMEFQRPEHGLPFSEQCFCTFLTLQYTFPLILLSLLITSRLLFAISVLFLIIISLSLTTSRHHHITPVLK